MNKLVTFRKHVAVFTLALLTVALTTVAASAPARAEVSFSFFYSNLSRYGDWDVSAEYGDVWCPREGRGDWHPYEDGRWAYTDVGWAWVSDYTWGSIPYHYGTWVVDRRLGWVWVPGYVWAPSWVVFRTGADYIGWAPVAPSFSVGVSFGSPSAASFVYVPSRQFLSSRLRSYVVPERRARDLSRRTRLVNNIRIENDIVVNHGPDVSYVEGAVNRRIRPERIERVNRVAPQRDFSRDSIRIDRQRHREGLRAAEPSRGQVEKQQPQQERPRGKAKRGRGQEKQQKPHNHNR